MVTYNTKDLIRNCLQSLSAIDYSPVEVTVVDNGSTDVSAAMISKEFPQFRLVESPTNLGYVGGYMLAHSRASGDFVLFLNSDIAVEPAPS